MLLRAILMEVGTQEILKVESFIVYETEEHAIAVEAMNLGLHTDCGCSSCGLASGSFDVRNITVEEAYFIMTTWYNVTMLDVRTDEEYAEGHIPGAILIPHDGLLVRHNDLPSDKNAPIIVYCGSGVISTFAANLLVDMGYTRVYNMYQGFNTWKNADYPYVKDNETEIVKETSTEASCCSTWNLESCEENTDCSNYPREMCGDVCCSIDCSSPQCFIACSICAGLTSCCFTGNWACCLSAMACFGALYWVCCSSIDHCCVSSGV